MTFLRLDTGQLVTALRSFNDMWIAATLKRNGSIKRVNSAALPKCANRHNCEDNLRAYAKAKRWVELSEEEVKKYLDPDLAHAAPDTRVGPGRDLSQPATAGRTGRGAQFPRHPCESTTRRPRGDGFFSQQVKRHDSEAKNKTTRESTVRKSTGI